MSRLRATAPFVVSSSFSLLGNSVAGVILPLVLLAKAGDALAAGALALACALPQVLAGVFGGVLLDHFNRRDLSIISDLISAASIAALPIIDATVGLSFGWFVLCGIIGAIGDIPGMTARDTLLPAVVEHDGLDLQRFMGVSQSIDSLTVIVGPAVASIGMGVLGGTNTLWLTAGLSLAAALTTFFVPRAVGKPAKKKAGEHKSIVHAAIHSTAEGMRVLFRGNPVLRASTVLGLLIIVVMGSYEGMVLPVYFTEMNQPALLGYAVSAMSVGALIGSLVYTKCAYAISLRSWYVASLIGMAIGVVALGSFASYGVILVGAVLLGFSSGPISALFGYFDYGLIPNEHRGAALGTQNSLMLISTPIAVFASSAVISIAGVTATSALLVGAWIAITIYALVTKPMRTISKQSVNAAMPSNSAVGSEA